jgi:hypothetical protein
MSCIRVEVGPFTVSLREKNITNHIMQVALKPFLQRDRESHFIAPLHELRRKLRPKSVLDEMLHLPARKFHISGDGRGKLHNSVIEKRDPGFEPMRHCHSILDLQKRRQKTFEIEVRHGIEVSFFVDISS